MWFLCIVIAGILVCSGLALVGIADDYDNGPEQVGDEDEGGW